MTRESAPKGASQIATARQDHLQTSSDVAALTANEHLEMYYIRRTQEAPGYVRDAAKADCDRISANADEATMAALSDPALPTDRPVIGAFPMRTTVDSPTAAEWIREDPRRLAAVVMEMLRFTADVVKVARTSLELAERLGIDENLAVEVVAEGIRHSHG